MQRCSGKPNTDLTHLGPGREWSAESLSPQRGRCSTQTLGERHRMGAQTAMRRTSSQNSPGRVRFLFNSLRSSTKMAGRTEDGSDASSPFAALCANQIITFHELLERAVAPVTLADVTCGPTCSTRRRSVRGSRWRWRRCRSWSASDRDSKNWTSATSRLRTFVGLHLASCCGGACWPRTSA